MHGRSKKESVKIKNPAVDLDKLDLNEIKKLSLEEQEQIQMELTHHVGAAHLLAATMRTKFKDLITRQYDKFEKTCNNQEISLLRVPVNSYAQKIIKQAKDFQEFKTWCKQYADVFIEHDTSVTGAIIFIVVKNNLGETLYDGRTRRIYSKEERSKLSKVEKPELPKEEEHKPSKETTSKLIKAFTVPENVEAFPVTEQWEEDSRPRKKRKILPNPEEENTIVTQMNFQNNQDSELWVVVGRELARAGENQNFTQLYNLYYYLDRALYPVDHFYDPNSNQFSYSQYSTVAHNNIPTAITFNNANEWDPGYRNDQTYAYTGQYSQQFQVEMAPQYMQQWQEPQQQVAQIISFEQPPQQQHLQLQPQPQPQEMQSANFHPNNNSNDGSLSWHNPQHSQPPVSPYLAHNQFRRPKSSSQMDYEERAGRSVGFQPGKQQ